MIWQQTDDGASVCHFFYAFEGGKAREVLFVFIEDAGQCGGVGRDGFCTSCGGNPLCRVCDGRGSVAQYNYVFEYTTYVKCGACGGKGGCRTCDATGLMACKPCYGMGEVLVSIKCKTCDGDGRK